MVVPAEEVPEQQVKESKVSKKKAVPVAELKQSFGGTGEKWIQQRGAVIRLEDLEIDVGLDKGQVRRMREDVYQMRLRDLEMVTPERPVEVTVWNPSAVDPGVFFFPDSCTD